jgi:hypothetical protein
LILSRKFGIKSFEFINYFPFDRPYDKYKDLLVYETETERNNIDKIFLLLKKEKLEANFVKFPKAFF